MKYSCKNLFLAAAASLLATTTTYAIDKAGAGNDLTIGATWAGGTAPVAGQVANWAATSNTGLFTLGATGTTNVAYGSLTFTSAADANPITIGNPGDTGTISLDTITTVNLANNSANAVIVNNAIVGTGTSGISSHNGLVPTLPGGTARSLGFTVAGAGSLTVNNSVTSQGTGASGDGVLYIRGSGSGLGSITGNLNIDGALVKTDTGTWSLSGNNTAAFAVIQNGTLLVGSNTALGAGPVFINNGAAAANASLGSSLTAGNTSALANNFIISGAANTLTLGAGTGNLTLNGTISESGFAGKINKTGAGTTVTLSSANTYTGQTEFTAGTLAAGTNTSFGSGPLRFSGGTIASSDGTARTFANTIDLNTAATFGGTGNITITGNGSLGNSAGGAKTITVNNSVTEMSGVLSSTDVTGSLTKAGSGTLIFSGANDYKKLTNVNAGTLLVNGNNTTATGALASLANTTVGGTGIIGAATATINGTLQGGTGAVGQSLTLLGAVTLADNSTVLLTLGAGGTHSSIAFNGTETFDGNQAFTFLDAGVIAGTTFQDILTGVTLDPGTTASWIINNAGWTGTFIWDGANIDLLVTAVPEPGAALLGGLGILALLRRRRA